MAMKIKQWLLGTLAYVLLTFPLAVFWHVGLFEDRYRAFGYFEGEPNISLGLLSVVVQASVLTYLYGRIVSSGPWLLTGLRYALLMGLFFWSCHVLAFAAKQSLNEASLFVAMESAYLVLQFGLYGVLLGFIYRPRMAATEG